MDCAFYVSVYPYLTDKTICWSWGLYFDTGMSYAHFSHYVLNVNVKAKKKNLSRWQKWRLSIENKLVIYFPYLDKT